MNVGRNTDQLPPNSFDSEDEEYDSEDEEDAYRLEDVSSDVEVDVAEGDSQYVPKPLVFYFHSEDLFSRFEEVDSEPGPETEAASKQDSKKRPRDSDTTDPEETKQSKSQQKKLNKKLKAEGGKAVATGDEAEAKTEKKEKKDEKEQKAKGETKELSGGVKIRDHKVGSGPQAKSGDTVSMRYVGKLQNGKIFDSNTKGGPVSLTATSLWRVVHRFPTV